jgi:hypothetical protein
VGLGAGSSPARDARGRDGRRGLLESSDNEIGEEGPCYDNIRIGSE